MNDAQHFALPQTQVGIARQYVIESRLPAEDILDGQPFSRIGFHYARLSNDAFRKSVFAETQDLIEDLVREAFRVAALAHAVDQSALKRLQASLALPGRHRAAQPVRLAGGKSGRDDRQLHDLLLEDGHPQGALEHRLDGGARIAHRLLAIAAAQVRMHHLALNRTGAYARHLYDEVVIFALPQARQHGHLRPRLDLNHAGGVRASDEVVHRLVLARHRREIELARHRGGAAEIVDQTKRP